MNLPCLAFKHVESCFCAFALGLSAACEHTNDGQSSFGAIRKYFDLGWTELWSRLEIVDYCLTNYVDRSSRINQDFYLDTIHHDMLDVLRIPHY